MTMQLHKRFSTKEVKIFLKKYLTENVKLIYILEILQITARQFFRLLKVYRKDPDGFSIEYKRKRACRRISNRIEKNIIAELTIAEVRIWYKDTLTDVYQVKNSDLNLVKF